MNVRPEQLRLYAVTDRAWSPDTEDFFRRIGAAIDGGATFVQLREKHMSRENFLDEARRFVALCRSRGVVRLINDANSSVAAMVQNSRAHGILHGAYDGTLTLEYVPIDMTVGEGDIVIASGSGGVYPRGIVIGTVRTIETDSSKLYHRIIVEPLFNIESCEEVLVLTGNETETERILNEELLQTIIDSANSVNASSAQVGAVAKALLNEANEAYRAAEEQRQAAERAAREQSAGSGAQGASGSGSGGETGSGSGTSGGGANE